ncbi:uncharacterized protein TNCV_980251 [Trichonephila clavipes]|uniref:Uncharacterized protein n=1 Tax=Trichonephila clavipes TaxID=2585209 RepID=A0A8X6VEC5_TRICX|nr:uncharacterized protein TNCV_980251 [Trichonephila clavipes]
MTAKKEPRDNWLLKSYDVMFVDIKKSGIPIGILSVCRCGLYVWDNHESVPSVIGNCSPDHDSRCRSSVSRPQTVWLQAFHWSPSDQHTAITGTNAEPFIRKHNRSPFHPPMSSGFSPPASQTRFLTVRFVTVLPTAARISAADAKQCATAVRQELWSSIAVEPHDYQNPIFLRQYQPLTTTPNNHA